MSYILIKHYFLLVFVTNFELKMKKDLNKKYQFKGLINGSINSTENY